MNDAIPALRGIYAGSKAPQKDAAPAKRYALRKQAANGQLLPPPTHLNETFTSLTELARVLYGAGAYWAKGRHDHHIIKYDPRRYHINNPDHMVFRLVVVELVERTVTETVTEEVIL